MNINKVNIIPQSLAVQNNNDNVKQRNNKFMLKLIEKYYQKCFPYKLIVDFFTFCGREKLCQRNFVFNYGEQTYIYNLSFENEEQFKIETVARVPAQILVSAQMDENINIFKMPNCKTRELIFDLDLTDYSDVRLCCNTEKKCCFLCWKYIKIIMEIVDSELRDVYHFKHILWVFSGRRGVHCYILDKNAHEQRDNIISELTLTQKVDNSVQLKDNIDFSSKYVNKSLKVFKKHFTEICITDQNLFASEKGINILIASGHNADVQKILADSLLKYKTNTQTSKFILQKYKEILLKQGKQVYPMCKIFLMLIIFSPRFDIQVTINKTHLLKCPFSLHSKSNSIAMPIDIKSNFDPIKDAINIIKLIKECNTKNVNETLLAKPLDIFKTFIDTYKNDNAELLNYEDDIEYNL